MRTLVLLMAALFLAAGLASAPAQAIGVQKEMKVGFIYISPIGEGGWSYAHDQARKFLSSLPGVTTSYVESVPEGQDAERIIQNMARKLTISFCDQFRLHGFHAQRRRTVPEFHVHALLRL